MIGDRLNPTNLRLGVNIGIPVTLALAVAITPSSQRKGADLVVSEPVHAAVIALSAHDTEEEENTSAWEDWQRIPCCRCIGSQRLAIGA